MNLWNGKTYMSHDDFLAAIESLNFNIDPFDFNPDVIVTFPRGGLVPSTYISHRLDLPIIIIDNSTYDFTADLVISDELEKRLFGKKILIVDDIIDTGLTIERFLNETKGIIKDYRIFTLAVNEEYNNPAISDKHWAYMAKKTTDFLVFPWEKQ